MPFFLVEIPMNNAGRLELELAARMLDAAITSSVIADDGPEVVSR